MPANGWQCGEEDTAAQFDVVLAGLADDKLRLPHAVWLSGGLVFSAVALAVLGRSLPGFGPLGFYVTGALVIGVALGWTTRAFDEG